MNTLRATKQLNLLGFSVTAVSNGRKAVDAMKEQHFDAIFMDCHMPVLDGLGATREIRERAHDSQHRIPIIAMTANALPQDRVDCLSAGMDDYISKPATLVDLTAVLDRWLPVL